MISAVGGAVNLLDQQGAGAVTAITEILLPDGTHPSR